VTYVTKDEKLCFLGFTVNLQEVQSYFKGENLREGRAACKPLEDKLRGRHNIELHLKGTPFQQMVWAELKRLQHGVTISYQELATRLGMPRAVRAVASAIGRNPVSILIPCHRVLRSDSSLGGYRWGLPLKEKLLAYEHTHGQSYAF